LKQLGIQGSTARPSDVSISKDWTASAYGLPADYKERLVKANAYFQKNVGSIPVNLGLYGGGTTDKVADLRRQSFKEVGFTDSQIDSIERNNLLQTNFEPSKKMTTLPDTKSSYDPDYSWNRTNVNVDPQTFQQIYQQKVASGQIIPSKINTPWTQQQSSQSQTSNSQSSGPGYMDIQVGDQRITRSHDAAGNYTGDYDPFAQAPPGEAGDTPGVEIAGYGLRPDGTSGMNKVGDKIYDPNTKKQYELVPSPKYGGGNEWQPVRQASDNSQDTQIAQVLPIEPAQQRKGTTGVGVPDTKDNFIGPQPYQKMNYPKEWLPKQAKQSVMPMVASYEPQGEVISERRKLKSPEEVLNKIPGYYDGKPAPLGFPVEPPPKMVNGMHPDLVDGKKVANRFNRLDPESAKAMPPTGNPHIDKKVKAARKKPK